MIIATADLFIIISILFSALYEAQSCHQESRIVLRNEAEIKSTVSLLNDSFTTLLKQLKKELKDTSVSEITEHLHDSGCTYLPLEELETCKDFKDLLRKLDKHYDFLDCDVLTTLAKQFATPTLSQEFQEQSEAAIAFRKSHSVQELRECLQQIFNPHIDNLANAPKAHIDLHDAWTERVINELFILIKRFFPTCDHLALTKVINITCSSVHITYFMTESPDEIEEIILRSKEKLAFMKYIGVCGMTINNKDILPVTKDESFNFDVALLDSAKFGQDDALKFLLEIGSNSEIQNALVMASFNGHQHIVKFILNNYPDISCQKHKQQEQSMHQAQAGNFYTTSDSDLDSSFSPYLFDPYPIVKEETEESKHTYKVRGLIREFEMGVGVM